MIAITKEERAAISERFPDAHIVRTMKQKSGRHHYYCEESKSVMRFLNRLRGIEEAPRREKEGGRYTNRKTSK